MVPERGAEWAFMAFPTRYGRTMCGNDTVGFL